MRDVGVPDRRPPPRPIVRLIIHVNGSLTRRVSITSVSFVRSSDRPSVSLGEWQCRRRIGCCRLHVVRSGVGPPCLAARLAHSTDLYRRRRAGAGESSRSVEDCRLLNAVVTCRTERKALERVHACNCVHACAAARVRKANVNYAFNTANHYAINFQRRRASVPLEMMAASAEWPLIAAILGFSSSSGALSTTSEP